MIDPADIRLLYLREIRSALRERNIVFNVVVMPIFMYPVFLWLIYSGIAFVAGQTEGFTSRVAIRRDAAIAPDLAAEIGKTDRVAVTSSLQPEADVRSGRLDLIVDIEAAADSLPGNLRIRLTHDASKDRSGIARERIEEILNHYRTRFLEAEAERLGTTKAAYQQFWIERKNVATGRDMGQFLLGFLVPITLIVMTGMGAMYPALDATAGERERSTWETLMTTATDRINIVIAKYLYVTTTASVAGLLNMAAMTLSARSLFQPLTGGRLDTMSFSIPWTAIPLMALFTVILALFMAAGFMLLAAFARTFKEGQSMAGPFFAAMILPAAVLQSPGIELTTTLAAIPVVNVCLVFREVITGVYHWPQIALALTVELVAIGMLVKLATVVLRYEDVLVGSYDGNLFKFLKQRAGRKKPA